MEWNRISGEETSKSIENIYVLVFRKYKTSMMCNSVEMLGIESVKTSKSSRSFDILGN